MNKVNKIIFSRAKYDNKCEFYDALFSQLKILIESGNVISIHENPEQKGIYAVQFANAEVEDVCPVWLSGSEIVYITAFASKNAYDEAKALVEDYEQINDEDEDWSFPGEEDKKPDA